MAEKGISARRDGSWSAIKVEVDVVLTRPEQNAPSIKECRFAVLPLGKLTDRGWPPTVVYDRFLNRIVDGVYYWPPEETLGTAQFFNEHPDRAYPDNPFMMRAPNGDALGLLYPGYESPEDEEA